MLQQSPYNTSHTNSIADSAHSRTQSAHPANNQIDFYSGLRCAIEFLNNGFVEQRIHLRNDACRTFSLRVIGFSPNQGNRALGAVYRGYQQRIIVWMVGICCQEIKNLLHRFGDFFISGEKTEVGVKA